ncbi:GIY-YIG nuclease family protein [Candidatus Kaiserbacteria bacterium]|nr:GIY-YIG nuclease family protein [Candidatus Kaiserbacteria bacterium]
MAHYIYILRCADDSLYTGYAVNVEERLKEHNGEGKKAGAKYTRGRRPVTLVYKQRFKTRSNAMKREAAIKQLSKKEKEHLIM